MTSPSHEHESAIDMRLLARSCADRWPYEPSLNRYWSHPALRHKHHHLTGFLVLESLAPTLLRDGVQALREEAMERLVGIDVQHFEVRYIESNRLNLLSYFAVVAIPMEKQ